MTPIHRRLSLSVCFAVMGASLSSGQEPQSSRFRETIREINAQHAAHFASGRCTGRLLHSYQDFGAERATPLVDCEFQVVFKGDYFRLERTYRVNRLSAEQAGSVFDTSEFVKQVFIYRGDENYWARFDAEGNASCLVLNRKWAQTVLQSLDSPGTHPMRLWETPCGWLLREDSTVEFEVGKLGEEGILARGKDAGYTVNCYLFPPRPLRLSRLTIQVRGAVASEYNLEWQSASGTAYVQRYAEKHVDREGDRRRTVLRVVEFDQVEPNLAVAAEEFELQALGVQAGTEFRANAPIPTKYVYDGKQLVRITQ